MMMTTTTITAKKKNGDEHLRQISMHAFGAGGISLGGMVFRALHFRHVSILVDGTGGTEVYPDSLGFVLWI